MSVLFAPGEKRVLVIIAHPDDAESFSGGTIARLADEGVSVSYLVVTRGGAGSDDPHMTSEQLMRIREKEQEAAARILGVASVTFLDGYYDGLVEPSLALREELTRILRQTQPDIVFTLDPWKRYEIHPDHRAVGLATYDAIAAARGRLNYPHHQEEGLQPHKVKQVSFFNTDQPNHYVDIDGYLERKIQARCCHLSQINPASHPGTYLTQWAEAAGKQSGKTYAESFHVIRL